MDFQRIRISTYNPAANGLVERFHRSLRTAIKSHGAERWTELLPVVFTGYRSVVEEQQRRNVTRIVQYRHIWFVKMK